MYQPLNKIKSLFQLADEHNYPIGEILASLASITDVQSLLTADFVQAVVPVAERAVKTDDEEVAMLARVVLEDILTPRYLGLAADDHGLFQHVQELVRQLKFVTLHARPMPEIQQLLREQVIAAFRAGIDVHNELQEVLEVYDDLIMEGSIAKQLGQALAESKEKLADVTLVPQGEQRPVAPTLGNWLLDYLRFGGPRIAQTPDKISAASLERARYFSQSPNGRKLSKQDQELLLKYFALYDWLRFGEKEDFDIMNEILAQVEAEETSGSDLAQSPVRGGKSSPPSAPIGRTASTGAATVQSAAPPPPPFPARDTLSSRPLNIQDILLNKRGQSGGIRSVPQQPANDRPKPPSPVQPPPAPQSRRPNQDVQDEIARKLAELKKRNLQ